MTPLFMSFRDIRPDTMNIDETLIEAVVRDSYKHSISFGIR